MKALPTTVTTLSLRLSPRVSSQLLCYQPLCICGMVLLFSLTAAHSADEDSLSLFVAGDMIVMRPLSNTDDPRFLQLVHEIRNADVAAVNLETLFHEFKGYPQANSGGTYMATSPEIAKDLAWAGIDMVGNANNHTYDYGSIGVLENLQNLAKARVLVAGVGEDLQQARAPKYFHHSRGTVALISAASSFVHYGKASRSRPDLHGRPGLNPLAIHSHIAVDIPSGAADFLGLVARLVGYSGSAFNHHRFRLLGVEVTRGRPFHLYIGTRPSPIDLKAILETIIQASRSADLIIVSIHAHRQGDWLRAFARQAIDAGADIFMAHGPHEILGIEIYRNRPIFYCLGDFFYEQHHIERLPVEYYERYQLGDDASVQDAIKARYATEGDRREAWEGLGAIVEFRNDVMRTIRLIPLDLGFGKPLPMRGRPLVALPALGRSIIDVVKTKSAQYGTEVVYIPEDNIGLIVNERPASEASSREGE